MGLARNGYHVLTWSIVALHQLLSEMNKMKRLFFYPYLPFPATNTAA